MANTRATLGDQATLDGLINHTLTSLEEDGVTQLRNYALYGQSQLTSVVFPNLTNTGDYAFQGCTGLTSITSTSFPNLTTIGQYAFSGCTGLTSIVFPNVTTIGQYAFQNCTTLAALSDTVFPNVTTINSNAFYGCTGLTNAKFLNVTSVQSNSFSGCTNLEVFETGTKKVSFNSPFPNCPKLDSLVINSTEMSTLNSATGLAGTAIADFKGAVFVPDDLVDTYKANSYWKGYFIMSKNDYPASSFPDPGDTFNSAADIATWTEIIANNNYATDYPLGTTASITFGSFGTHQMELIAIDTDIRSDGDTTKNNGKARMTWLSKTLITTHNINSSNTTSGGWPSTAMRSWLIDSVKSLLPSVVRNNIVEVDKTYKDYSSSSTKTSQDTVWIPSYREMFGGTSYENSGVDYTSYFSDANSRKKAFNGSAYGWWLRSAGSSSGFRCVSSGGSVNSSSASSASGVALGFCL